MKLTTKGRYAVTAMLDLAVHGQPGGQPGGQSGQQSETKDCAVSLADIAARQDISLAYLEQLFTRLRRHGLVTSTRGPGGGYRLGRDAAVISIADIVCAVDESLDSTRCAGEEDCQKGVRCLTHQLWEDLNSHIHQFLSDLTLAELARRKDVQVVAARQCKGEYPLKPMRVD